MTNSNPNEKHLFTVSKRSSDFFNMKIIFERILMFASEITWKPKSFFNPNPNSGTTLEIHSCFSSFQFLTRLALFETPVKEHLKIWPNLSLTGKCVTTIHRFFTIWW